ncbi:MAG: TetR/AcrR family transcriptional regulator [Eubacteriales bacterium]|jgi:AcrR family transcriptional regulator|nr:TetR/AcrR family transcriptional regulator [Bacillota bacterium]MBV1728616.1 TetR/AcrR family transcriptional regulator [Desulforudis sp.]MDZ4042815.1 TetR/AcrR family transcriptional regulator [Eubacteriales bacterium]MBU4554785.1 TetR/AcrR family transcriptional regulator [Bacillota bacterium]MBV1735956.1 TetR/AcrR family transcriptional regulator [Desulforudis sp.]
MAKNVDASRDRIVQAAGRLFDARGYRHVTLNDIAGQLGMSKKTIYQYFAGKEAIAEEYLQRLMHRVTARTEPLLTGDYSLDIQLEQVFSEVWEELLRFNPLFLDDIKRYAPELWKKVERYRDGRIMLLENLIRKGQTAGDIRDLDPRLAVLIYLSAVRAINQPDVMAKYGMSPIDVYDAIVEVFLSGIKKKSG